MKKVIFGLGAITLGAQLFVMAQSTGLKNNLPQQQAQKEYVPLAKAGAYEDFHIYMGSDSRILKDTFYKSEGGSLVVTTDETEANVWWDTAANALIVKDVDISTCVQNDGTINLSNKTRTFFANLASGRTYTDELSLNIHFYGENKFSGCMYGFTSWDYPDKVDTKKFKQVVFESKENGTADFQSTYSGAFLESVIVTRNGDFKFSTTEPVEAALHSIYNVIVDGGTLTASSPFSGIRLAKPSGQVNNIVNGGKIIMESTATNSFPFLGNQSSKYKPSFVEPADGIFETRTGVNSSGRWSETEYIVGNSPTIPNPKRIVLDGLISSDKNIINLSLGKTNYTPSDTLTNKDELIDEIKSNINVEFNGSQLNQGDYTVQIDDVADEILGVHTIKVTITYVNGNETIVTEKYYSINVSEALESTPEETTTAPVAQFNWWAVLITILATIGIAFAASFTRKNWFAGKTSKDKVIIKAHKKTKVNESKVRRIKQKLGNKYEIISEEKPSKKSAKWYVDVAGQANNKDTAFVSDDRDEKGKKFSINDIDKDIK